MSKQHKYLKITICYCSSNSEVEFQGCLSSSLNALVLHGFKVFLEDLLVPFPADERLVNFIDRDRWAVDNQHVNHYYLLSSDRTACANLKDFLLFWISLGIQAAVILQGVFTSLVRMCLWVNLIHKLFNLCHLGFYFLECLFYAPSKH